MHLQSEEQQLIGCWFGAFLYWKPAVWYTGAEVRWWMCFEFQGSFWVSIKIWWNLTSAFPAWRTHRRVLFVFNRYCLFLPNNTSALLKASPVFKTRKHECLWQQNEACGFCGFSFFKKVSVFNPSQSIFLISIHFSPESLSLVDVY